MTLLEDCTNQHTITFFVTLKMCLFILMINLFIIISQFNPPAPSAHGETSLSALLPPRAGKTVH